MKEEAFKMKAMQELFAFYAEKFNALNTEGKLCVIVGAILLLVCLIGYGFMYSNYQAKIAKRRQRFYDDIHKLAENSDKEETTK